MAKITEEKIIEYINTLDIDAQIEIYDLVKQTVSKNLQSIQKEYDDKASQYQQTYDRINNNQ